MSRTKFEERRIALNKDNKSVLSLWGEILEKELIKLGRAQKLPRGLDRDKHEDEAYVLHYFAVVKEILLRTMAWALQSNGSLDNKAQNYLAVFNTLQSKLPRLTLAKATLM